MLCTLDDPHGGLSLSQFDAVAASAQLEEASALNPYQEERRSSEHKSSRARLIGCGEDGVATGSSRPKTDSDGT
ncbi:hypothetical protein GCM10009835_14100 [Planosporangium flavigriseum]|uniref:Uncharacterized protein n=1 Tax=Planosporangium flavigriseum TaxID=373681 RepID=A0A8J3PPC1_9ACTN|nr:hypothetical protein Pfl04_32950 [Planosporangium flavigriseum]